MKTSRTAMLAQGKFKMMHCPKCQTAAHAKSSRYISRETKERYHQCQNINCSCTFKTHESVAGIIVATLTKPAKAGFFVHER